MMTVKFDVNDIMSVNEQKDLSLLEKVSNKFNLLNSILEFRPGALELLKTLSLESHDFIADACFQIPLFFGANAKIALEVEFSNNIYLIVGAELSANEANIALDYFFDNWWINNVTRVKDVRFGIELLN